MFFVVRTFSQDNPDDSLDSYTVHKGTIESVVRAPGTIKGKENQNLAFGSPGFISEIFVEEGTTVEEGTVIAKLNTTSLESELLSAQGSLQSAQANYNKVVDGLDVKIQELQAGVVLKNEEIAKSNYQTSQITSENSVAIAQLNSDIAQETHDNSEFNADLLKEEADQAEDLYRDSEDVAALSGPESEDVAREQTELAEIQYQGRVESAESSSFITDLQAEQSEISLESTTVNSEHSLVTAENQYSISELNSSIAELQTQQLISSKKYDLTALDGQIKQAKSRISSTEYALEKTTIRAPFPGTIISIPFKVGDYYPGPASSSSVYLADVSEYIVEVEINELDILSIQEGQSAIIEFESDTEGTQYSGSVTHINPAPIIDPGGVVNYIVEVSFTTPLELLYEGLSVDVEIITNQSEETLVVPLVGVSQESDGYYVTLRNGTTRRKQKVEIGLSSDFEYEILAGLSEGDVILY
ncbi:efflux RND transporter periplasmic adaptor subunit [Candidatus Dojkabacteria bacterium]|uniref:Efflux RND transporter periplasmic adaptor subunit n=1 Tax=Candidatus Dojkabacteria bacterium TaxID=2099670 RepID=A0A955L7P9_9BACT|nr:efflux RND transporter periplasmic adaptor subunit [Candidatus Dojkabacteria bacterium]